MDAINNFAYGTVLTAPDPAASGTTLVLDSGQGSRFPDPATDGEYNITIKPFKEVPVSTSAEICRVTAISTDTMTITRTQESSSARTIIATDEVYLGLTKKTAEDAYPTHSMGQQAIMNGNQEIAQRGTTSASISDNTTVRLIDRFYDYHVDDGGTLPDLVRTQEILTPGAIQGANYYSRLTTDGAGASLGTDSRGIYDQNIENGTRLLCGNGKKVTISFWARSDIASKKLGIQLGQNYGAGGSPTAEESLAGENWTVTSSWVKYTHTFTTNTLSGKTFGTTATSPDYIRVAFHYAWGTDRGIRVGDTGNSEDYVGAGYIDIAQVQLCAGSVALPFQPKSFEQELDDCQRYFQKSYPYATALGSTNDAGTFIINTGTNTSNWMQASVKLHKQMRTTPTVVTYDGAGTSGKISTSDEGTSQTDNVTPTDIARETENGFEVVMNITTEAGFMLHWTASADL